MACKEPLSRIYEPIMLLVPHLERTVTIGKQETCLMIRTSLSMLARPSMALGVIRINCLPTERRAVVIYVTD